MQGHNERSEIQYTLDKAHQKYEESLNIKSKLIKSNLIIFIWNIVF